MQIVQNRRRFLANATIASIAGLTGLPETLRAEPPPETTTVRIRKTTDSAVCEAPKYVAAELLRAEGFTDVRYDEGGAGGTLDFDLDFPQGWISWIEIDPWNEPWTVLTGLHSGCLQLIANDTIQTVPQLKGKRVGVPSMTSSGYQLLTLIAAYVGLDPGKDIEWIANDKAKATTIEQFTDGKIDAFLGFPPEPQELLARKIGHVILNTTLDQPWSQYYCCMLGATKDYVSRYPIATKRVLRAFLKAVDICRSQPALAARVVVDHGITEKYDYTLEALTEARYDRWRDFDPEDTLRFYALRMQEVGLTKSSPQQFIAKSTNWQFLNELKRELKT